MAAAAAVKETEQELEKLVECSICLKSFTDPRMLPCIHTFCLQCLERIRQALPEKQIRDIPCPICRKVFPVPADGISGLPKNFFMENLKDVRIAMKSQRSNSKAVVACDICRAIYEEEKDKEMIREATMWCLQCSTNFCDFCAKAHKLQSKDHRVVKLGTETEEEIIRGIQPTRNCFDHKQKPLDFYCSDCKTLLCVSCFVEDHASHKCKDVTTIEGEIRQAIQKNVLKISGYADDMLSRSDTLKGRTESVLLKLVETESEIVRRNSELKQIIDMHTVSLLQELSAIKEKKKKDFEIEKEEVERFHAILKSFEGYCDQLKSKGSASDVCGSVNDIIKRADQLEKDHKAFISRPVSTVNISLEATDLEALYPLSVTGSNILGRVQVTDCTTEVGTYVVVVGRNVGDGTVTREVVKMNLQHPYEVSNLPEVPARMRREVTANVCDDTIYVSGIGIKYDEIWRYNVASGWMKCKSLIQGRCRHSAAFIDGVLYICGGIVVSDKSVLDSVEAYDSGTNKCATVGKLAEPVESSGNCLVINDSLLYIFGGSGKDGKPSRRIQVYNTMRNTCVVLAKTMPCTGSCVLMRAVLWETSVILLGRRTCLLFDLNTETLVEMEEFRTGVDHFGLVVENGRIFVIGGGTDEKDGSGKTIWTCTDRVISILAKDVIDSEFDGWTIDAELPVKTMVQAYAKMTFKI